jgi:hypothetical protein
MEVPIEGYVREGNKRKMALFVGVKTYRCAPVSPLADMRLLCFAIYVPVTDQVTEVSTQDEVTHVGNGSISIHEILVAVEGEETGPKLTPSNALSRNISANISTGSTSAIFEVNETEVEKDKNGTKGKVITEVYDLKKILDEQEAHDIYCPNCKTCITRRVVLKDRTRTLTTGNINPVFATHELYMQVCHEPPESELSCGGDFAIKEDRPDVFGCLSCFAFFIPTGIVYPLK